MKDDPILRAFGQLDQPVAPDPVFARDLYARLAADLGLRARPGVIARVLGRVGIRPTVVSGIDATPRPRLALAVVVVAVVVVAGGRLFAMTVTPPVSAPIPSPAPIPSASPSPSASPQGDAAAAELVRLSQAAQADPPAVRYVLDVSGQSVTLPNGELADSWTVTVSADGNGTWRSEAGPDDRAGGYSLYDGQRYAIYEGITRSWVVTPVENGGPPFPMNDAFAWTDVSYPGEVATLKTVDCSGATSRGEVVIAGRTADRVWCPGLRAEYALDRRTHLVLRLAGVGDSGTYSGPVGPGVMEVTSFEETAPDPAAFDWSGPVVAKRASGPIDGTRLAVGERPPTWSGTTITGKPFSIKGLTGPTAILFLCLDCTSGPTVYDRFNTALAAHPGVRGVIVGQGAEVGTLTGFVDQHPTTAVVISDVNSDLPTAWGYPYLGGLVVLGTGGRVGDVLSTRISADDYERVFAAAEQGLPIPAASRIDDGPPASSSAPPASSAPTESATAEPVCDPDLLVICHVAGWPAPAWTGPMPDGTTFDSASLAGKPAVIWFGDLTSRASIASLAALADRYAGRASVVLIMSSEQTPGETAAVLQAMGAQLPVVFDWDGSIRSAFKNVTRGAILLDATGRLVSQSTGGDDPALQRELDGLLRRPAASP